VSCLMEFYDWFCFRVSYYVVSITRCCRFFCITYRLLRVSNSRLFGKSFGNKQRVVIYGKVNIKRMFCILSTTVLSYL